MVNITLTVAIAVVLVAVYGMHLYHRDLIMMKNKLEKKLDSINHQMELIRTVVPIMILIIQVIILCKI